MSGPEALGELLERVTGLRLDDDELPTLQALLAAGMKRAGVSTAHEYLERVRTRPSELAELSPAITVSETYFMQNQAQFTAFHAILRARQAGPSRRLRVLSAGCATGEEPYSLAIATLETLTRPEDWSVSILGVDLNPSLAEGPARSYSSWAMRETPPALREKYFREAAGRFTLAEPVRALVRSRTGSRTPCGTWAPIRPPTRSSCGPCCSWGRGSSRPPR